MSFLDSNLLATYQREPSDETFRELVVQHAGMVHATAARLMGGDRSAADDVSQEVFLRLLKKAPSLSARTCVAGWLYRQTCRISSDLRRSNQRRKKREQFALSQMNDQNATEFVEGVDDALASLPERDRDVILLRFFEEMSHRAVGASLGISEDAARKRCARAVEALRTFFAKKGQAFSVGTLGILLAGLASKPLSAATLTQILPSSNGLAGATKGAPVLSFVAGLALAGLSGTGVVLMTQKSEPAVKSAVTISDRNERAGREVVSGGSEFQSIERVIEQVRFLVRRPRNAMTEIKLEALFDSIPVDQREEFFVEARDVLSIAEKRFSYTGFLKNWLKDDPEAAMNLCLAEDIENQLENSSSHLVQNLFQEWERRDPAPSSVWLKLNWDDPGLDAPGFPHSLKVAMSHDTVGRILNQEGVASAFEAAKAFGDAEDFPLVAEAITGTLWNQVRDEQGTEIYRYLAQLPEPKMRDEMLENFIGNWKRFDAGPMIAALDELEPAERLRLELDLLGEFVRETEMVEYANGSFMRKTVGEEPTEQDRADRRSEREEDFRGTARLAGMNDEQANLMIAEHYLANDRDDASRILELLPSSLELDGVILEAIRRSPDSFMRGSADQELKDFRYAQYLSSRDEKERISRALFRRVIVKNPHHARSLLESADLSPDILKALKKVALRSSL